MAGLKRFRAALERLDDGMGWVVAWLPFDVAATWPKMVRRRVVVEVGGESFRTSLFAAKHGVVPEDRRKPGSTGEIAARNAARGGHFFVVNKKMQAAAGAGVGAMVEFGMAPDLATREVAAPPELAKFLKADKALARWYPGLSESIRREIVKWIDGVKSAEARARRGEQVAERLMLTMEGERELPPVLEVAFRRRPRARAGWAKMTPAQRRGELMAIFYYQSPEAREKRVGKVCDAAEGC